MYKEEIKKLLSFYEENLRKHQETIDTIANKDESPVSKMYSESSKRYSEGFKDAIELVMGHLNELVSREEEN